MESSRRLPTEYNTKTYGAAGYGRDYTSLATWESDTDNDLVSTSFATGGVTNSAGGGANYVFAFPITINANAPITSIGVNWDGTQSGNFRVALYSAGTGKPSTLLAESDSVAMNTAAGWQDVALSYTVTAGSYWVAVQISAAKTVKYISASRSYYSYTYGAFPSTWSASAIGDSTAQWNMRVSVTQKGEVLDCYADRSSYSENPTFVGSTTNSSSFRVVRAAAGQKHAGVVGGVNFVKIDGTANYNWQIQEPYFQLQDVCLKYVSSYAGSCQAMRLTGANSAIVGCIVYDCAATNGSNVCQGITLACTTANCFAINCLAYGCDGRGLNSDNDYGIFYNCTSFGNQYGFRTAGSATVAKNCVSEQNTVANWYGTWSKTTCTDGGGATFKDAVNKDFHLAAGDTVARNQGTVLSSDAIYGFDDDIDGSSRYGTWDIGADERLQETVQSTGVSDASVSDELIGAQSETLETDTSGLVGIIDLQKYKEIAEILIASGAAAEDVASMMDSIVSAVQSETSAVDVGHRVDDIEIEIQSGSAAHDSEQYLDAPETEILSDSSVNDVMSSKFSEILLSSAQSACAAGSAQSYVDAMSSLLTAQTKLSDVAAMLERIEDVLSITASIIERRKLVDSVSIIAISSASVAEVEKYIDAIVSQGETVITVDDTFLIGQYLYQDTVPGRLFAATVPARFFADLVQKRTCNDIVPSRIRMPS